MSVWIETMYTTFEANRSRMTDSCLWPIWIISKCHRINMSSRNAIALCIHDKWSYNNIIFVVETLG